MKEKPTYYATLPANVRYDNDLTPNAKLLYAEITVLTQSNGVCWASDNYFMDLYGVKRQSIQRWLKSLEDKGYISREVIYKKNSNEIEKRYIRVYTGKIQGYTQYCDKGIHNNDTGNNTSINNTSINKVYERFEDFYSIYPKKKNRGQAERAFKKMVKNEETLELIIKDLKRRKNYQEWNKDNGQYIPYPSTYLNAKGWLDEYETTIVRKDYIDDRFKPKD